MSATTAALRERRRSGLGLLGCIVWALVALGIYSAWKFTPAYLNEGRIERNVEHAIRNMPATSTEDDMLLRIVTRGSAGSIQLDAERVSVVKETLPGQRIFHIAIEFPNRVRYLGSERTLTNRVQLTRVMEVDEIALARQREYERERQAAYEAEQRRAQAFADEVQAAYEECEEKWGRGNCAVSETHGGDSDSIVRMY
ncbi:MAG TPA: hypothetical protein VIY27_07075 [Myxococcota bacterium]